MIANVERKPGDTALTMRLTRAAAMLGLSWLAACQSMELDEKYGPRRIEPVEPLTTPLEASSADGPLKPSGAVLVGQARRRALTGPEVYVGGGATAPRGSGAVGAQGADEGIALNFVQTEIAEVVDAILGRLLGVTYVIDERVSGTITMRSATPIPRRDLLAALENMLAANGAAIVETGGVANIVPLSVAREMPRVVVVPRAGPQARGYGTFFIRLERADAASVQQALQSQVSSGSQLVADPPRNMLIFTGPALEAQSVEEMARVLDVDLLAGRSFAMIPLSVASPANLAEEIGFMLGGAGGSVVPIERMNGVLAVANSPRQLRELADWVARLDRADSAATRQVFVYYVRSGLATELAETLNATFGTGGGRARSAGRPGTVAPGRERSFFSDAGEGLRETTPGSRDDAGAGDAFDAPGTSETAGRYGAGANYSAFGAGDALAGESGDSGLRIVADARRNAIVVRGSENLLREVHDILRRLDTEPVQILIEATIAEVLLNDELAYGLRWAFETGDFSAILSDGANGVVGPSFPGLNLILDTTEALAVLRALAERTNVEVVSSPQLMVIENETARLQVGDQVPVLTEQAQSIDSADAPIRNQINYIDTGVILEVTPSVNADGVVSMQVRQEVSDAVRTESSGINSPTIQQRRVNSTVAVRSGQTVALGGLIRERRVDGESGVPVLMDIPYLGNFFKVTSRTGARTELLVLITPRVIRDSLDARTLTEELRRRLRRLEDII